MLTINGIDGLKARAGEDLGVSDWHEVTQAEIDAFADATGDHQWIHVDPERAKETPFGGTIAHGYYTLSLSPHVHGGVAARGRRGPHASTTASTRCASPRHCRSATGSAWVRASPRSTTSRAAFSSPPS